MRGFAVVKDYFVKIPWRFGIWLTQGLNGVIFNRNPDHSTSGATGYKALQAKQKLLRDADYRDVFNIAFESFINFIFRDKNHCYNAIEWDEINDSPENYPKPE